MTLIPTPIEYGNMMHMVGYIDPGTGHVFQSSVSTMLGFLIPLVLPAVVFFRRKIFPFIKRPIVILLSLTLLIFGGIYYYMKAVKPAVPTGKKVVVLGFDGMDPRIMDEAFRMNLLPHFKKLKDTGIYAELATTTPPQSPVAWASFTTGTSPAKHGVYDFLVRDPKTYRPDLSFSETKHLLKAKPFWEKLTEMGVPATILFLPDTFPAPKINGKVISGMGTTDILGTQGTFSFFSTKEYGVDHKRRGKYIKIENKKKINTQVLGPQYDFLGSRKTASVPLTILVEPKTDSATLTVQGHTVQLKKGAFSGWIPLEFSIDFFTRIHGMAYFYLKSVKPEIELYLSPINIDPNYPVGQISNPPGYAKELQKSMDYFSTLGLPDDTWALEQGVLTEQAFLTQNERLLTERKKIYFHELSAFREGLLVAYFGNTDVIQHMFWRFSGTSDSPYRNTVLEYYKKMDEIVGATMKRLDKNTSLIILSDHGFGSFDYEMNVNTWLKTNGYLMLREGKNTGGALFEDVDWANTKAYAVGYNGIYINQRQREGQGIVAEEEADVLLQDITAGLMKFTNPHTGDPIFKRVYTKKSLGIDKNDSRSPDLFLGYYRGTRSSWDTAIGATPGETVIKRKGKWSGDHFFDATEVPGILFTLPKLDDAPRAIEDVMPRVLKLLHK